MRALRVLLALLLLAAAGAAAVRGSDETCYPIEVSDYSPTGTAGCTLDGPTVGKASWYPGVVAAANWCTYPFIAVGMYCDCYTGTPDERLIDLTRAQVIALGLDPDDGIFAVTVTPLLPDEGTGIPDTAAGEPIGPSTLLLGLVVVAGAALIPGLLVVGSSRRQAGDSFVVGVGLWRERSRGYRPVNGSAHEQVVATIYLRSGKLVLRRRKAVA